MIATALAVLAAACAHAPPQPGPPESVRVRVDPDRVEDWTVDPRIFGRFFEHNGRDAYPGIYDQHLANGSFEAWYESERGRRTEILYPTEEHPGLAFPWEPAGGAAASGRARPVEGGVNGRRFQRLVVAGGARGGIEQRTVLPDRRTAVYDLTLSVRGGGVDWLRARLSTPGGDVLARARVPVTGEWRRHTVPLELERPGGRRYRGSPLGEYVLRLTAEAPATAADSGHVDLDAVMLVAGDAVAGRFNPTTIELLREFDVTGMRWPGGNWASAYHWEDGVGDPLDRPVRRNRAWGGLEPNHLGTNEFLEFCRLAGLEPLINVGFNEEIPPEEAARWVEYVNGDTTTAMGRLRAAHGHPEPWGVELWQVGNEVYGAYQIGHTDAEDFARRFVAYRDAMKAVDPEITVIAAGIDPGYVGWGGNEWNETLLDVAGTKVEAIDIHRYVKGIRREENRAGRDPIDYLQGVVAFPTQFEALIGEVRGAAAERGVPLRISVGEWNGNADVSAGWPDMDYPNMAHAAFVAGMYNAFIRQGDAVRFAYQRDNTLYFRAYPHDFRPVNPGAYTLELYAEPFRTGERYRHLPLEIEGPSFFLRRTGRRIRPMADVPYVDGAAVRAEEGGGVVVYLTNRDLRRARAVALTLAPEWRLAGPARARLQWSDHPFAEQTSWEGPDRFELETHVLQPDRDGALRLRMPPASVLRLRLETEERTAVAEGGPG